MHTKSRISRRQFGKAISFTAAGLAVVSSNPVLAAMATPRQVEGPFYPDFDLGDTDLDLTLIQGHTESALGEHIVVHGRVFNTDGEPLAGATVDIWQANAAGRYRHTDDPNPAGLDPNFQGWGIVQTDAEGYYRFKTIKPGAYPLELLDDSGWRAMHIHYKVSHAGQAPITTQLYFPGDPLLEQDSEIKKAPENLRDSLISIAELPDPSGLPVFRFDVVLGPAA
ncbi:MAG TPA: protocatechuate 3,4-dioxygenase [Xanthomonadales bacterium]|nr:protocatechuate 3,4-dioxygenase [Xanthomonadales bacterium]